MTLMRRFRAKADMSFAEAERRRDAACAGATHQREQLPPSIIAERLSAGAVATVHQLTDDIAAHNLEPVEEPEVVAVEPLQPRRCRAPDYPTVTITISGDNGTTTISHLIRNALAHEGISFEGPEDLRSMRWRAGLDRHLGRGLRVVLIREETGE